MDHRVSWTGLRRPNRGWPHLRRVGMVRSATERGESECVGRIRPRFGASSATFGRTDLTVGALTRVQSASSGPRGRRRAAPP